MRKIVRFEELKYILSKSQQFVKENTDIRSVNFVTKLTEQAMRYISNRYSELH